MNGMFTRGLPQRPMRRGRLTRFAVLVFALLTTAGLFAVPASAASNHYTLAEGSIQMPIAETYILDRIINRPAEAPEDFGSFNAPQDLFINKQGYLFIVDTGNNRVVKMSADGHLVATFTGPESKPFNKPQGVFVDDEGNMYIADTGNYRIVHLSADGSFVEQFVRPNSEKLDKDFIFDPSKVVVSPTGYIYAIKGQSIISIDGYNNFRGYVGQNKVSYSFQEVLLRLFASEKQLAAARSRTAAAYTNITLDSDNMIVASTMDTLYGQIKRLNAVGNNTYREYGGSSSLFQFNYGFDDLPFTYGDYNLTPPEFVDLCVNEAGIITALDAATCKAFQYDSEGNLLGIFGSYGDLDGAFQKPVSIVNDQSGNLYILDAVKNNIQVFSPTKFLQNIHGAVEQYHLADYEKAEELWQEVLTTCENYQLANIGMGKAAFKLENWQEAMAQYKLAADRVKYSEAFAKYRHSILRNYFLPVVGCAILILVCVCLGIYWLRRVTTKALARHTENAPDRFSSGNMLLCLSGTIFHPFDTLSVLKGSRKKVALWVPAVLILAALATRICFIYTVHYPLVKLDPRDASIVLETAKFLLPILTYTLSIYLVGAIVGGESKLDEIFTAMGAAMTPYILITLPLCLFSHVLCRSEQGLFLFFVIGSFVLVLAFIVLGIYLLNNYTLRKTIVVAILSLLVMVLIWIIIIMILALSVQLYEFVLGIFREIKMLSM